MPTSQLLECAKAREDAPGIWLIDLVLRPDAIDRFNLAVRRPPGRGRFIDSAAIRGACGLIGCVAP